MATNSSNHSNCTDLVELLKHYYLPVAYSLIFIVGLVGNMTSISIYLTKLRPWKSSSIIMVNLAVADFLYVLTMPFLVYYYSTWEMWPLCKFMCRFVRFGFHFNLYGSILFLTCHAVFRYLVVTKPLSAAQIQQKRWGILACSAVWISSATEITPMLNMISLDNNSKCIDFASTEPVTKVRLYGLLLTALGFLLPLVVVCMCHTGIAKQLVKGPHTTSVCRMRARGVTMLILVVFVVCFLPFHVLRVLRIETRYHNMTCPAENIVHAAYVVSRPLAGFNTFFNLALYTLSGDRFRRAFLDTFHWERLLNKTRSLLHLAIISEASRDTSAS